MPGLKNVPTKKLTTALVVISAAMVILAVALAPADNAAIPMSLAWVLGAVALTGAWIVVAIEISKRLFGGGAAASDPQRHGRPR